MQKILGQMRRAIADYNMISPGDRIAVGVSGGKDSLTLLEALARLRPILNNSYSLVAITLDPGFFGKQTDYGQIEQMCARHGIEYIVKRTEIGPIIFDYRQEKNPCSLCARMRRGSLHDAALEAGCNKVALGHHADDAVETFIMNLLNEGRVGCFSPVTYLSRKDITMIRPLIYTREKDTVRVSRAEAMPIIINDCPANGHTERERTKQMLRQLDKQYRGVHARLLGAMQRGDISGW